MFQHNRTIVGLIAVLTLAGCSDGGGLDADRTSQLPGRPGNTQCLALAPDNRGVRAFPSLSFESAITGIHQAPGQNGYWYVTTQDGTFARFDNVETVSGYTKIGGSPTVHNSFEAGLLSMAFHPAFATNGFVYLSYVTDTADATLQSRVTRYTLDGTTLSNPVEILSFDRPSDTHNGGQLAFGPDGYLYASFGDGGGAGDTYGNGQNLLSLHAKLLRLDVDGGAPYQVPADNPFVGDSRYRPEIFALGFRNPWRFSVDRATGEIWLADVGQYAWEEVNRIEAGKNYGWPIMEASHCYYVNTCATENLSLPVWEYDHSAGCAITGGFVYRGAALPRLNGYYLYGDYCTHDIMGFSINDPEPTHRRITTLPPWNISSFGEGNDGEILIGIADGTLYRLADSDDSTASSIPQKLSEHPCYANVATQQLSAGVIPYSVQSPLWSDGADKTRFIALPDNSTIDIDAHGDMIFPAGTVLIKQFSHNGRPVETRFLMNNNGWSGYSYEWNDSGTDATLSTTQHSKVIDDSYTHLFPSTSQCFQCHKQADHVARGLETLQLNGEHDYDSVGVRANQLDAWQHMGLFNTPPTVEQRRHSLATIDDTQASISGRARAYLHSNCSGCHNPEAFPFHFDLRYTTTLADAGYCNMSPWLGDLGITDARILVPGDKSRSLIYQRMNRRDENRMPPLGSAVVDDAAVAVVGEWIDSMNGCP